MVYFKLNRFALNKFVYINSITNHFMLNKTASILNKTVLFLNKTFNQHTNSRGRKSLEQGLEGLSKKGSNYLRY